LQELKAIKHPNERIKRSFFMFEGIKV